jgi:nucleoside-diphosphate-sugar epimerase
MSCVIFMPDHLLLLNIYVLLSLTLSYLLFRDFIHIDDRVRGMVTTTDNNDDGSPISTSAGVLTSFK